MNPLHLPWLELSIAVTLIGAVGASLIGDPIRAFRWGLAFTGTNLACAVLAWLGFYLGVRPEALEAYSVQPYLFGRQILFLDGLSAPLVPAVALLHFLTALATPRTKMRRFSASWSLTSEAIRLAAFSCKEPWLLIALLAAGTLPGFVELLNRGKPTRVYLLHMIVFVGLMVAGWLAVEASGSDTSPTAWATVPLMIGILVRCGVVPAHCWITDWFEHSSFGNGILFVAPLTGVYAAIRLVLPIAPGWVLQSIGMVSLITAVYASAMAIVQQDARRFFAYLFLSHASLVLVGLELHTSMSLTGALCVWFSVIMSLGGFGLTLRAVEARFGRLSLSDYHGLYDHSPMLAVCFLLTGLASVGFPGTLGFVSAELLVDGAVQVNMFVGLAVIVAAAFNGIAVVRAYFRLFTGARHASTVFLGVGLRERIAVLTLMGIVLGAGLLPQPGVSTRQHATEEILKERMKRFQPDETAGLAGNAGEQKVSADTAGRWVAGAGR
jgi:NADH-quinone oxidoreductase subunit M